MDGIGPEMLEISSLIKRVDKESIKEEEASNVDLDKQSKDLMHSDNISMTEKTELNSSENKEVDEDPRRKRRRSSAST